MPTLPACALIALPAMLGGNAWVDPCAVIEIRPTTGGVTAIYLSGPPGSEVAIKLPVEETARRVNEARARRAE
jgi:hypothetical protein